MTRDEAKAKIANIAAVLEGAISEWADVPPKQQLQTATIKLPGKTDLTAEVNPDGGYWLYLDDQDRSIHTISGSLENVYGPKDKSGNWRWSSGN